MQVFATAGVSKRISIYEYSAIMANPAAETHRPSQELATRSKLSCLSWNKYLKTYLASSDYEGVVHVWDIATGQNVAEYEAHEKRIWSVDFCHVDPKLLMSGSDDGMVKVGTCLCCRISCHNCHLGVQVWGCFLDKVGPAPSSFLCSLSSVSTSFNQCCRFVNV